MSIRGTSKTPPDEHEARPWLVRPHGNGFDAGFVAYWAFVGVLVGCGLLIAVSELRLNTVDPGRSLFADSRLYFEATKAWLAGLDPWAIEVDGVRFAAPPPALLLNLPLQPFGPDVARAFWAVANVLGWVVLIRRLRLGPWWILFAPFVEAFFQGSADPALAAGVLVGAGWFAAITKPYSIPSIVAEGRWRQLVVAVVIVLVTVPFLPWGTFISEFGAIQTTLAVQNRQTSAWGNLPLMALTGVALILLGWRKGLQLVIPTLWPNGQFHYSVFSARAAVDSAALGAALSIPYLTAPLVVLYAAGTRVLPMVRQATAQRAASRRGASQSG